MLLEHINAIENILLAQSTVAHNAGHPCLKGWPREWFIRDFLQSHLPSSIEIGHGEIIDHFSNPNPQPDNFRNEVDIVLYRNDLPKIAYSPDNTAFLCEGVLATLEVKSELTKDRLNQACQASLTHKTLKRNQPENVHGNLYHKNIISYVIAYTGPENISTVANWLPDITTGMNSTSENLVDVIIILGKGVIWQKKKVPFIDIPEDSNWIYIEQNVQNLFFLFTHMMTLSTYISTPPDVLSYGYKFNFEPYGMV